MPYDYQTQRAALFTEEGQVLFMKIRDKTRRLLATAGAARMQEMVSGNSGDSWTFLACVDRMVELDEIREVTPPDKVAGQHRVFVAVEY